MMREHTVPGKSHMCLCWHLTYASADIWHVPPCRKCGFCTAGCGSICLSFWSRCPLCLPLFRCRYLNEIYTKSTCPYTPNSATQVQRNILAHTQITPLNASIWAWPWSPLSLPLFRCRYLNNFRTPDRAKKYKEKYRATFTSSWL